MKNLYRSQYQQYPFHMVTPSPWPIVVSMTLMSLALTLTFTMHGIIGNLYVLYTTLTTVTISMTLWFRDIITEGTYLGDHTLAVRKGINLGFLLFVVSEVLIFSALFWTYFHSTMNPDVTVGNIWPPKGIVTVTPMELPLLNTIILLTSGATITWSHHGLITGNRNASLYGLLATFWLIVIFVACQYVEFINANFTITDGVYGSVFYAGTGLHFMHMVMLIFMLGINYWRLRNYHLSSTHHVGYETTILYLHCLDIIWLFLYITFYWWGY
ncbi:cytochrome oxidase subunit 3 (mitochondrion) [Eremothecium sinecaudum]|uniref:Cytochrome c oxidase subunit 3 n=1 Tax=Eremothecium sinecaudum TaxID=45286 RepID=A0A0X8HX08_9SACH|nr:cytochrome oxidase subunit 3 [Eremothecium sinecaudum]AMD23035.1 cytochrome oxidase subunit 3 [Eremothecium sinecaudum]